MFQAEPTRPAGIAGNLVGAALHQGGTVEYAMMGDVPVAPSVPQVSRAVEVDLSAQELANQPAVSSVVLRATVDAYGYPRNVTVVHSANAVLDKKVLAAVGQFRFTPATLDNKAVDAPVTITIKIEKK
jgi:TonB family protein